MGLRHWRAHRALKAAASRYFSADELARATIADGVLAVCDARFELGEGGGLVVTRVPDDERLRNLVTRLGDDHERAAHEAAWFLRVRRMAPPEEIERRARTGELYDARYFAARGESGSVGRLADELVDAYAPRAVLDVGCATGELVRALEQRDVGGAAGIDISAWAVAHRVSVGVRQGTALDLPYRDKNFDLVVSRDFLSHVHPHDLPQVLREQARVTRPGGHVVHLIPFGEQDVAAPAHVTRADPEWWLEQLVGLDELDLTRAPAEGALGDLLPQAFELVRRA